jgi:RNA polymerase sigma-70 factor (ECF subfamily)
MTVALEPEEDGPERSVETQTPETILLQRVNSGMVQKALGELMPHHREVLLLCDVEEMSYQEISDVLAIPMGTVMSRLARARKAFRELVAPSRRAWPSVDGGRSHDVRRECRDRQDLIMTAKSGLE